MRTAESPSRDSPRSPNDKLPRIAASTVNAPQSKANLTVDFTARSSRPAFFLSCKTVATPIHYQCLLSEDFSLHAKLVVEGLHSLSCPRNTPLSCASFAATASLRVPAIRAQEADDDLWRDRP